MGSNILTFHLEKFEKDKAVNHVIMNLQVCFGK